MITASTIKRLIAQMSDPNDTDKDLTHALGLSALVYFSNDFIIKTLEKVGLPYKILEYDDMKCLIAENDTSVFISFRGTNFSKWSNWKRILNIFPRNFMYGLKVHGGFELYWKKYFNYVDEYIKSIKRDKKIVFTGHSLGAAIASLYNISYTKTSYCKVFACPKYLYNTSFKSLNSDSYRIRKDIVTWIPFTLPLFTWSRSVTTKAVLSYRNYWNIIGYHSLENYIKSILKTN